MRIDAGLDTGDMLLSASTAIGPEETAPELSARLAATGAPMLLEALRGLDAGTLQPTPQDHARHTLAPILKKEDGRIDWTAPAQVIYNRMRGFNPWPGAWTTFRGQQLHILAARPSAEPVAEPAAAAPGTLLPARNHLRITCGDGTVLDLLELQLEGRKRVPTAAFLNGHRLTDNERLGESST